MKEIDSSLIFIVGFPTSGKTSIGKLLAKKLNVAFYDTDQLIEEKTNKRISEIFESEGEESFRLLEKEILESLKDKTGIVSTGGGMPCFHSNMDTMIEMGTVIYLYVDFEILLGRFRDKKATENRPLLSHQDDLRATLEKMWEERNPFYVKASVILHSGKKTKQQIVNEIVEFV
jgi:shikimate kinase